MPAEKVNLNYFIGFILQYEMDFNKIDEKSFDGFDPIHFYGEV